MWFWIGLLLILFGVLLFCFHGRHFNKVAAADSKKISQWLDCLFSVMIVSLIVAGFVIAYFSSYYPGHIIYLTL